MNIKYYKNTIINLQFVNVKVWSTIKNATVLILFDIQRRYQRPISTRMSTGWESSQWTHHLSFEGKECENKSLRSKLPKSAARQCADPPAMHNGPFGTRSWRANPSPWRIYCSQQVEAHTCVSWLVTEHEHWLPHCTSWVTPTRSCSFIHAQKHLLVFTGKLAHQTHGLRTTLNTMIAACFYCSFTKHPNIIFVDF